MPIPVRKQTPTEVEGLFWLETDDGSSTLWDAHLNETYHSGCGAIAESMHVYLINSQVAERLHLGHPTSIFEVGFGTGTNFWLTAAVAAQSGAELHYAAVESSPLPLKVFRALELQVMPLDKRRAALPLELQQLVTVEQLQVAQSILALWRKQLDDTELSQAKGWQRFQLAKNITLDLSICRLEGQLEVCCGRSWEAVYFDAFSPQTSPELWTTEVFQTMFNALKPGGRLVTYCVKRTVQDALRQAGFAIQKVPGPTGGKREVLVATKLICS